MNIDYLKQIELGKTLKSGFIIKYPETVLGAVDESKRTYFRPHSAIKLSFPEEVQGYRYEDFLEDFEKMLKSKDDLVITERNKLKIENEILDNLGIIEMPIND